MTRRRRYIVVGLLVLAFVAATVYVFRSETTLQRAESYHHAEPPNGVSALRYYQRVMENTRHPLRMSSAMFQAATIYDHGILQGRYPVLPDIPRAVGMYRQIAMVGAPLERALARQRLIHLGDRVFENPPPRMHPPVRTWHNPLHDAADVVELRDAATDSRIVRSDSQNVHDSSIVKSLKVALDKLGPSPIPLEKTALEVRAFLEGDENALKGLDLTETNTIPITSLKMTESEVLRRVWGRIRDEPNQEMKENMKTMLKMRLAESGKEVSCASGRIARIVDSLTTFDARVSLKPLWALRKEMMDKASLIREKQGSDARPLKDVLRETFKRDYVDTGLTTMNVVDAELGTWGEID